MRASPHGKEADARDDARPFHLTLSRCGAIRRAAGLLKPVVWSVTSVTVLGRECLEKVEDAYVVVANHTSHLDTPLIMGALPRRLARYLAVGAAADYFFDVWRRRGLTALFFNAFPVDRTGASARRVSARALLNRGCRS